MAETFAFGNSSDNVPGDEILPAEFSIKAPIQTDVWSEPPNTHSFTAPILYRSIPLKSFKTALVSLSDHWQQKHDQGGLILARNGYESGERKYVKAGIEFVNGRPHLSTVTKDRWAGWSLSPIPTGGSAATLEIVRDPETNCLWVYFVEGVQRSLQQVIWLFQDEDEVQEFWVGAYAAMPSDEGDDLVFNFGHLVLDLVE